MLVARGKIVVQYRLDFLFTKDIASSIACIYGLWILVGCGEVSPVRGYDSNQANRKQPASEQPVGTEEQTSTDSSVATDDDLSMEDLVDSGAETDTGTETDNGSSLKKIDNSGASFQAKDIALLRSSVASCMGDGMTIVQTTMLLPKTTSGAGNNTPDANGRIQFLLPIKYKVGEDIIELEKLNLVDVSGGARTGVTADALTDTYLRSLETIANVVAHNCDLSKPACDCSTKDAAHGLLSRCLPGIAPDTVEIHAAADAMAAICTMGSGGMRKAIASFLSSYAFANAR